MEHSSSHQPQALGPAVPPHKQSKRGPAVKEIISTVGILLLAPIAAVIFTAFVFQFYRVDGPSMEETLQNNDRLIVYKLPKSLAKLTGKEYIPARDEIIVFNLKEDPSGNGDARQLIKRVIGIPGDRIVVKDNTVTLYNDEHPDGYDPDAGTEHQATTIPTTGDIDLVIPDNQVFVMGDNRANSLDSRSFEPIPVDNIVGKLVMRVFPFKPINN